MDIKTGEKINFNVLILDKDLSLYNRVKESSIVSDGRIYFSDHTKGLYSFIRNNNINVIITHVNQKPQDGASFVQDVKAFDSLVDVILVGKSLPQEKVVSLINKGATAYLSEPIKERELKETLKKIQKKRELRQKTFQLERKLEEKYVFQGMVGKSPYMLEIFSLIEKIAPYFTSVLLTGETGSGKELVARAIHNLSPVKNRRLVVFDCVSVPESLFESELFGYKRGAFTGADRDKEGLFERADKGIIFLDEIGEMPLPFQVKLLRVLEQHQVRPLGATEEEKVDVRVIASTNRDLKERMKEGEFREDLYHRLNKVEIHLPPLRERKEDIPLLVRHFLRQFNQKFNKEVKGISQRVQKAFHNYEWTGNVRELENVLERAVIFAEKEFIDMRDLPSYFQESLAQPKKIPFIKREELSTMEALEKEYITYLLKITQNNLKKTAEILDVSRTTLYNKIRKYDIPHH